MNFSMTFVIFLLTLLLASCTSIPSDTKADIDRRSLLFSMNYIQNELLETSFLKTKELSDDKYRFLLGNYCDLTERGVLFFRGKEKACKSLTKKDTGCAAYFHRCVGECGSLSDNLENHCSKCEKRAIKCLNSKS